MDNGKQKRGGSDIVKCLGSSADLLETTTAALKPGDQDNIGSIGLGDPAGHDRELQRVHNLTVDLKAEFQLAFAERGFLQAEKECETIPILLLLSKRVSAKRICRKIGTAKRAFSR